MLSQTSEYALRAVVHLARIGGGPAVTDDIAAATQLPPGYLARVLRRLSRSGLLSAQRGIGGGFSLARPAHEISAWDVLDAADATPQRIKHCPVDSRAHQTELCALHQLLDDLVANAETRLRKATIQELLASPQPLCGGAHHLTTLRTNGAHTTN